VVAHGLAEARACALAAPFLCTDLQPTQTVWQDRHPVTGQPLLLAWLGVDGDPFALLLLVGAGGDFDEEDESAAQLLAAFAAVAVSNARTFALSERRREWLEAAAEVTASQHSPEGVSAPIRRMVAGAVRVMRAGVGAAVRASEHGFDVAVSEGPAAEVLPGLLEQLRPRLLDAQASGRAFEVAHGSQGTAVVVPLDPQLALDGALLVVLDRGRGALSPEERDLVVSFVAHGSLVLDRAVLAQERHEAVVAADRDRIARDLHDVVVQRLYATGMKLRSSRSLLDLGEVRDQVREAARDLDVTIRDIRSTIFELEHGVESSLRSGVTALAREYERVLGFAPVVRTWGPINLLVDRSLAEQALAVLREALSNCARHAQATACVVEVTVAGGWLTLEVVDDGRGPGEVGGHVSGLRNLHLRAEALGGELRMAPASPRGTRFSWRVPVDVQ
jgi:signal transduction histidine kinase